METSGSGSAAGVSGTTADQRIPGGAGDGLKEIPRSITDVEDFRSFIIHLTFDTAKNLALLAALSIIFFSARWLQKIGMDDAHVRHIQALHFWMTYPVLVWIGFVFVVKLMTRALK